MQTSQIGFPGFFVFHLLVELLSLFFIDFMDYFRSTSCCLQKADRIGITQHGRADGLCGEACSLAQPHEQEGQAILGEWMP